MSDDVLAMIDSAVEGRCACLCGRLITARSPSAYFASESCSQSWRLSWLAAQGKDTTSRRLRDAFRNAVAALHELRGAFDAVAGAFDGLVKACRVPPTVMIIDDPPAPGVGAVLGDLAGRLEGPAWSNGWTTPWIKTGNHHHAGHVHEVVVPSGEPVTRRALRLRRSRNTGPAVGVRVPRCVDPGRGLSVVPAGRPLYRPTTRR